MRKLSTFLKNRYIILPLTLLGIAGSTFAAGLNCSNFDKGNGIYKGITTEIDNTIGNDCDKILDYFKNSDTNGIHYSKLMDKILGQNIVSYENIATLTGDFFNMLENKVGLEYGGKSFNSLIWLNKGITFFTKDIFIGPNVTLIFPHKTIYSNLKYVPIVIYAADYQLPDDAELSANIYVTDRDLSNNEEDLDQLAKAKLKDVKIGNKRISVFDLNLDELRGSKDNGELYIYVVVRNIYGNKSQILKSKIIYNREELKTVLGYTSDYITYDGKKWTRNPDVNFVYLYSNLEPKSVVSNNDIKVSLSDITSGSYKIGNTTYKFRAKISLYDLKQGKNNVDLNVEDIYGNVSENNKITVYLDSKGPEILKKEILPEFAVNYNGRIYINPTKYKKENGFDMLLNVKDLATKTTKVIIKTDLGKKIIVDIKDGKDYIVKQLQTSFDENEEKILQIEAYDILGNISKTILYYNTLNLSYPVVTFPPKDNLIVVNNSLDFKGICSGVSKAEIKFKLNDNPESNWISYEDSWTVNQLLKKGYNLFKVKCKNIVGESDWVERIVIYEPKENIGGRNNSLQMYPSESNKFYMERSNKNADNDTLKVVDPVINKSLPGFNFGNKEENK